MVALQHSRTAWTPDEAAQLQRTIKGGPVQNTLRQVGRLSPQGNALTMMLEAGTVPEAIMQGHPMAAAVPIVGAASKIAADRMTANNTRNLMATILRGGTAAPPKPPVNLSPLANALAAYGAGQR